MKTGVKILRGRANLLFETMLLKRTEGDMMSNLRPND